MHVLPGQMRADHNPIPAEVNGGLDKLDPRDHRVTQFLGSNNIDRLTNLAYELKAVFRIQILIRTDPHKEMPPGSGFAWTDADPDLDPGGKKAQEMYRFIR